MSWEHIFHEYDISDHASTYFSLDFLPQSQGPGVFRAHPSLLNKYEDHTKMRNLASWERKREKGEQGGRV